MSEDLVMTLGDEDSEPVIVEQEGHVVRISPPAGDPFVVDRGELLAVLAPGEIRRAA